MPVCGSEHITRIIICSARPTSVERVTVAVAVVCAGKTKQQLQRLQSLTFQGESSIFIAYSPFFLHFISIHNCNSSFDPSKSIQLSQSETS